MNRSLLTSVACALLVTTATIEAQAVTTTIGELGGAGCQGTDDPPTLTLGVPASATFGYDYDVPTGVLTLTVTNTSAVVGNTPNPLLTRMYLNVPTGAVLGATLIGQTGSGGANPDFEMVFGANSASCLGDFDIVLRPRQILRGIANANAPRVGGLPGPAVIGPVTFTIRMFGPGIDSVDASDFANSYSVVPPGDTKINAGGLFLAGGTLELGWGWIGSGQQREDCAPALWAIGRAVIGSAVEICRSGRTGCNDSMWISLGAGPTPFGNILIPIGFPLLTAFDNGQFGPLATCVPCHIPSNPAAAGITVYFVVATFPPDPSGIPTVTFGNQFALTIVLR